MAKKKTAMVQPPPAKPSANNSQLMFGKIGKQLTFEEIIHQTGNDRAYTILSQKGYVWRVLFAGDYTPSTVKLVDGKPVIIRDTE